MKIAVLGTGSVGTTIGSRLIELGHEIKMGSRTANNEKAAAWAEKEGSKASAGTFAEAASFGEILFNCTKGDATLEVLQQCGKENLSGKILVDISNPLDGSQGFPPTLSVCNTDSLGEQIQKAYPGLKVVKSLNTMWCGLMVNPRLLNDTHNVFMCGNDEAAKQQVATLLKSFGWQDGEITDLGDITTSRGTEMYLPLWLRLYGAIKTGAFNLKVVK